MGNIPSSAACDWQQMAEAMTDASRGIPCPCLLVLKCACIDQVWSCFGDRGRNRSWVSSYPVCIWGLVTSWAVSRTKQRENSWHMQCFQGTGLKFLIAADLVWQQLLENWFKKEKRAKSYNKTQNKNLNYPKRCNSRHESPSPTHLSQSGEEFLRPVIFFRRESTEQFKLAAVCWDKAAHALWVWSCLPLSCFLSHPSL